MYFLLIFLGMCALVDQKSYRIPNGLVFGGMFCGMILQGKQAGIAGLTLLVLQGMVVFLCFYPFYRMKGIGAGDVKLFIMVSCFYQQEQLLRFLCLTFVLAAGASLVKILLYQECKERVRYLLSYLRKVVVTGSVDVYEVEKDNKKTVIRLAIPSFFSAFLLSII